MAKATKVFACPAASFVSPAQRALGWDHRSRSVAMNGAVGNGDKYDQPGGPFGWNPWYVAKKMGDLHIPGPSDCWWIMDEHPDSIDDGIFYTSSYPTSPFIELPGNQHGGACGLVFLDGHSEIHKWVDSVLTSRTAVKFIGPNDSGITQQVPCSLTDKDMLWLAMRTPKS